MGAPTRTCDGIIGLSLGKVNKKKLVRTYNDAYNQISNLWKLLPESARICLKSEDGSDTMDIDDAQSNKRSINTKIDSLEDRLKLFKGKHAAYKDKMMKKKCKRQLKRKKKSEEKQLQKEEKKKKKKELKEKLLADKLNCRVSASPIEKIVDEVVEQLENLSANEELPVKASKSSQIAFEENTVEIIPSKKKKKKQKREYKIEDMTEKGAAKEESSGISKKKLKLIHKQEMKAEKKRNKRKLLKIKRQEEVKVKAEMIRTQEKKPQISQDQNGKEDIDILFNKIDLASDERKRKFRKDKLKIEKDPAKALIKIEELSNKITGLKVSGQEEKAAAIKDKETWKKAILKADGVKVKDDVKLLKKAIKRKEKKKNKSKEEWKKRTDFKDKKMADAQKKRKENILKKKKEKKQKKIKKSIKKGRVVI